ncbi:hypothetical protein Tco_1146687 [Tanacetum coccineum]
MDRQCTQPKRPRNVAWFKEKTMLAEAQESGQILDEEQLAFFADPCILDGQAAQTTIPNNAAFQTKDLDAYDSDCDDVSNAKAVLMANLSNFGLDVMSEVSHFEPYHTDMDNQSVHAMQSFEQTPVIDFTDNKIMSDNNIIPTHEKMIDSQMDDIIIEKLELKQQIDSLEQNLSNQIKEKESLLQTFTVFENKSKEKESKYMDKEIDLEKKIKELDNIVYKVGQSAQTVHISVISSQHAASPVIDDEETLILEEVEAAVQQYVLLSVMNSTTLNGESVNLEYFEDNVLKAQQQAKTLQFDKHVLDNATTITNATTIAPEMFRLDIEPLSHILKNNRDAHEDYLKNTIENIGTIHGLVEHARKQNPSEPLLDSSCKFTKHVQELLVYVSQTCPSFTKPSEELVAITPMNKVKKVRFSEPLTSLSNIHKQVESSKTPDSNTHVLPSTGLKISTSASRSQPTCEKQKQEIKVYSRRPKQVKSVGSSKKAKMVESKIVNNSKPTHLWGFIATDVPSSSSIVSDSSLCYPTNDSEDLGKLNSKADIGIFVGYLPTKKAFRIYNRRTHKIMETIHVTFDELTAMASEQFSSGPGLQDRLFQPMFDEYFNPPQSAISLILVATAPRAVEIAGSPSSTTIDQDVPSSNYLGCQISEIKDEAPELSSNIKNIQVRLNATVRNVRTDNGTEFVNQTLRDFYEKAFRIKLLLLALLNKTALSKDKTKLLWKLLPQLQFFSLVAAAPRAVEIAGSPSSTTIDQDAPSSSTSSTNQQQKSSIISQGVEEPIPNALFDDPCHEPLHDVSTS